MSECKEIRRLEMHVKTLKSKVERLEADMESRDAGRWTCYKGHTYIADSKDEHPCPVCEVAELKTEIASWRRRVEDAEEQAENMTDAWRDQQRKARELKRDLECAQQGEHLACGSERRQKAEIEKLKAEAAQATSRTEWRASQGDKDDRITALKAEISRLHWAMGLDGTTADERRESFEFGMKRDDPPTPIRVEEADEDALEFRYQQLQAENERLKGAAKGCPLVSACIAPKCAPSGPTPTTDLGEATTICAECVSELHSMEDGQPVNYRCQHKDTQCKQDLITGERVASYCCDINGGNCPHFLAKGATE